jgi:hypothetical protein
MKESSVKWLLILSLVLLGIATAALAPLLPVLMAEARLSDEVERLCETKGLQNLDDGVLRSRLQALARKQGFHLEFGDIFLQYLGKTQDEKLPSPSRIGYTLPMELRLFGFVPWRVVAVRLHVVSGASKS